MEASSKSCVKKTFLLIYGVLFLVLFLICAMIWHWQMAGSYFICERRGIILDFLPPFIDLQSSGDIYLKPRRVVYAIWSVYAGVAILLPGVSAWLLVRLHDKALKNSWT